MIRTANLLEHLPSFVREYREIHGIMKAENPELQTLEDYSEVIKNNMFILYTNDEGIERYEEMLGLTSSQNDSLYNRQMNVLASYTNAVAYTFRGLVERLNVICGVGNYTLNLNANEYTINIELPLRIKNMIETVRAALRNMIPANMICTYTILYNTHKVLSQYPTCLLMQFTHQELREEVIEDNISVSCDNFTNYTMESFESITCENISNFGMRKVK